MSIYACNECNDAAYRNHMKTRCECVIKNREPNKSMRDWLKRIMCMHQWMQTDFYQEKLNNEDRDWPIEWNEEDD